MSSYHTVRPIRGSLRASVRVPSDKSIAHRTALLAAWAEGPSELVGFPRSRDPQSTLSCLSALGVPVEFSEPDRVRIRGVGLRGFRLRGQLLDCGNSGTTMRLLCGMLVGQRGSVTLDGDASLRRRPMERVAEPLRCMGGRIETQDGCPPVRIQGAGRLCGATFRLPIPSAQVKSAILLAGLLAEGETVVFEASRTRDHTERLLGLEPVLTPEGWRIAVQGGRLRPQAGRYEIPGDPSAAAFWAAAAALVPGSEVELRDVGLNPTRTAFLELLRRMGAEVEAHVERWIGREPVGRIRVRACGLRAVQIGGSEVPALIDELPVIAVLAAMADGESRITGASELRLKESDRIRAMTEGLRRLGARVEELPDGWAFEGPIRMRGGRVSAYQDHRVAMALAVAGLLAEGETIIEGAEWVEVSYPGFWETLERLSASAVP
ncbi:MAG: 3-phosphoshikimate 1-carboxyvinyltransferase [Bacteroidota bacterium]|nr:3-phosphoshikimate 1-carboxyvinyltransferase [Bacteroidota bacterium]MDW8138701.1 3-phosphoshikimate 1-carboxyvinyltransferase [Bacteroidota bacterium]